MDESAVAIVVMTETMSENKPTCVSRHSPERNTAIYDNLLKSLESAGTQLKSEENDSLIGLTQPAELSTNSDKMNSNVRTDEQRTDCANEEETETDVFSWQKKLKEAADSAATKVNETVTATLRLYSYCFAEMEDKIKHLKAAEIKKQAELEEMKSYKILLDIRLKLFQEKLADAESARDRQTTEYNNVHTEIEHLKIHLTSKETENAQLKSILIETQLKLTEIQTKFDEMRSKLELSDRQRKSTELESTSNKVKYKFASQTIKLLKSQVGEKTLEITNLKKIVKSKTSALERLKKVRTTKDAKKQKETKDCSKIRTAHENLKRSFTEVNAKNGKHCTKNSEAKIPKLTESLENTRVENKEVNLLNEHKNAELSAQRDKKESDVKQLQKTLAAKNREVGEHGNVLEKTTAELIKLKSTVHDLQQRLQTSDQLKKRLETESKKLAQENSSLKVLQKLNSDLLVEKQRTSEKLQRSLSAQSQKQAQEIFELNQTVQNLESDLAEKQKKIYKLEQELSEKSTLSIISISAENEQRGEQLQTPEQEKSDQNVDLDGPLTSESFCEDERCQLIEELEETSAAFQELELETLMKDNEISSLRLTRSFHKRKHFSMIAYFKRQLNEKDEKIRQLESGYGQVSQEAETHQNFNGYDNSQRFDLGRKRRRKRL